MTIHPPCGFALRPFLTMIFLFVPNRLFCNMPRSPDFQGDRSFIKDYFQEKSYTGQETYKRDVKHNIKRDEHVDTAVQNFEYGDTEVRFKNSGSAK